MFTVAFTLPIIFEIMDKENKHLFCNIPHKTVNSLVVNCIYNFRFSSVCGGQILIMKIRTHYTLYDRHSKSYQNNYTNARTSFAYIL